MKFRKIEKPNRRQLAEIPLEMSYLLATVPELGFFTREVKYWRDEMDQAKAAENESMAHLAGVMKRGLQLVSRRAVDVLDVAQNRIPYDPVAMGNWYGAGRTLIGWSRMWREATAGLNWRTRRLWSRMIE